MFASRVAVLSVGLEVVEEPEDEPPVAVASVASGVAFSAAGLCFRDVVLGVGVVVVEFEVVVVSLEKEAALALAFEPEPVPPEVPPVEVSPSFSSSCARLAIADWRLARDCSSVTSALCGSSVASSCPSVTCCPWVT